MKTKALVGMAALALAAAAPVKAQQLMVYDAHNKVVGRYEANGAPLNGYVQFGEAAIRQIAGVWLALPITGRGFVDNATNYINPYQVNPIADADQDAFAGGAVYWTGANCTGTPWVYQAAAVYDTEYQQAPQPAAPLVQNAVVLNGYAYFAEPNAYADKVVIPTPATICSIESISNTGPLCGYPSVRIPGSCANYTNVVLATSVNLTTLGFMPPFSVR